MSLYRFAAYIFWAIGVMVVALAYTQVYRQAGPLDMAPVLTAMTEGLLIIALGFGIHSLSRFDDVRSGRVIEKTVSTVVTKSGGDVEQRDETSFESHPERA